MSQAFDLVSEPRAASVLYNFLAANRRPGMFYMAANVCPELLFVLAKVAVPFTLFDIEPRTLCIDREAVLARASAKPANFAGLIYVRTYGVDDKPEPFFAALKQIDRGIIVVDDRCLGAPDLETTPSIDIDLRLYSTGGKKYVDLGSGGFGHIAPGRLYHRQTYKSGQAFDPAAEREMHGDLHGCLNEGASFDTSQCLERQWLVLEDADAPLFKRDGYLDRIAASLPGTIGHKAAINELYTKLLPSEIQFPEAFNQWRFNVVVPRRDELLSKLFAEGLFASAHYASLAPVWPASVPTPEADNLKSCVLNLFNDGYYSLSQAEATAAVINDHVAKHGNKTNWEHAEPSFLHAFKTP